jgi:hypothetical protein
MAQLRVANHSGSIIFSDDFVRLEKCIQCYSQDLVIALTGLKWSISLVSTRKSSFQHARMAFSRRCFALKSPSSASQL